MLSIFAIPKRFTGHFSVIQRNAIQSWLNLAPRPEIILFGDEIGTGDICRDLGLIHIPDIKKNVYGTPLISDIFDQSQVIAGGDILCYVNCDIIFSQDLIDSIKLAVKCLNNFLIVGKRVDLDIDYKINFADEKAVRNLMKRVDSEGTLKPPNWIDYFIFRKGTISNILPFGVGRPGWDNWLLWHSSKILGLKLVDATESITAIHQNHDYSHHADGFKGVWESEEAIKSYEMVGGPYNFYFISNCDYRLKKGKFVRNVSWEHVSRLFFINCYIRIRSMWFYTLKITRPIRHKLGIKKNEI